MKDYRARTFRMFLFIAIALVGFAADLGSKHWIFEKLGRPGEQPVWWMIDGVFGFQTSLNQGALFGLGQGQIALFVTLSIIALLGVALWVWTDPGKNVCLASTLGLITAGILGNLWDRVGLHRMTWTQFDVDAWSCSQDMVGKPVYAVRDWILVMIGDYPWPNFNIADSCLVCGAILIGVFALFTPAPKTVEVAEKPDSSND